MNLSAPEYLLNELITDAVQDCRRTGGVMDVKAIAHDIMQVAGCSAARRPEIIERLSMHCIRGGLVIEFRDSPEAESQRSRARA